MRNNFFNAKKVKIFYLQVLEVELDDDVVEEVLFLQAEVVLGPDGGGDGGEGVLAGRGELAVLGHGEGGAAGGDGGGHRHATRKGHLRKELL